MGTIISSMSSALSSTVTAIICFFIFAYFYLRLNDARIQLLTHIEDMTSLYLVPRFTKKQHTQDSMVDEVTALTARLNQAADRLIQLEQSFIGAGDRLQIAVDNLHGKIQSNSLDDIKDLIRKGFHLSEPEYEPVITDEPHLIASADPANTAHANNVANSDDGNNSDVTKANTPGSAQQKLAESLQPLRRAVDIEIKRG